MKPRPSMRRAINEKCRDCLYDPANGGTWLAQVAQCSAKACPLWPLRPAPKEGPFADPPRDPETVTREWLTKPHGEAVSSVCEKTAPNVRKAAFAGLPLTEQGEPAIPLQGVA